MAASGLYRIQGEITMMANMPKGMERNASMQRCMDDCCMCMTMCSETMMMGMQKGSMSREMMCMLQDCMDMCDIAMRCMMRMSPMSGEMCKRCAESCKMMTQASMAA